MKYLFTAEYNASGAAGVIKDGGTTRQAAVENLVKSLGGTLESCYFGALNKNVFMVVDIPDEAAVTAVVLHRGCERCDGARDRHTAADCAGVGRCDEEVARLHTAR